MATVTLFDKSTGEILPSLVLRLTSNLYNTLEAFDLQVIRYVPIGE